jgi:hypothetical protein
MAAAAYTNPVIPSKRGARLIGISNSEQTTTRLAVDSTSGSITGNIRILDRHS